MKVAEIDKPRAFYAWPRNLVEARSGGRESTILLVQGVWGIERNINEHKTEDAGQKLDLFSP